MGTMEEIRKTFEARIDAWKTQIESMEAQAEADKALWDTINSLKEKGARRRRSSTRCARHRVKRSTRPKPTSPSSSTRSRTHSGPEGKRPTRH
jgi:hypothetical protein